MKKVIIRRIGVSSFARLIGVAQAIWGLVFGFISMFAAIAAVLTTDDLGVLSKIFGSIGVVLFCLVVIPMIAFLFGWLYGAVLSLVANLFLQTSHGLEIDTDEEKVVNRTEK